MPYIYIYIYIYIHIYIYIYAYNIYLHTYIYGAVNTDIHGWGRATETLALGCPGTTTRFKLLYWRDAAL